MRIIDADKTKEYPYKLISSSEKELWIKFGWDSAMKMVRDENYFPTITNPKEDISDLLVKAFNDGYELGLEQRQIGIDVSQTGDSTLVYKINGKEYRQMTLEDLTNGL